MTSHIHVLRCVLSDCFDHFLHGMLRVFEVCLRSFEPACNQHGRWQVTASSRWNLIVTEARGAALEGVAWPNNLQNQATLITTNTHTYCSVLHTLKRKGGVIDWGLPHTPQSDQILWRWPRYRDGSRVEIDYERRLFQVQHFEPDFCPVQVRDSWVYNPKWRGILSQFIVHLFVYCRVDPSHWIFHTSTSWLQTPKVMNPI